VSFYTKRRRSSGHELAGLFVKLAGRGETPGELLDLQASPFEKGRGMLPAWRSMITWRPLSGGVLPKAKRRHSGSIRSKR